MPRVRQVGIGNNNILHYTHDNYIELFPHIKDSTQNQLFRVAIEYLAVAGKERDAASELLARFLVRRDITPQFFPKLLEHAQTIIQNPQTSVFAVCYSSHFSYY